MVFNTVNSMRHQIQQNQHNAASPYNLRKYTANISDITSKDMEPITREAVSTRMNNNKNNNDYLSTTSHSCSSSNSSSPSPSLSLNTGIFRAPFCEKLLASSAVMKLCFEESSSINKVINSDNDSTLVTGDTTLVEVSNASPIHDTMVTTRSKLKKQQIESLTILSSPSLDDEQRIYLSSTSVSSEAFKNMELSNQNYATNITADHFEEDRDLVSLVRQSLAASSASRLHASSLNQNQHNKVIYLSTKMNILILKDK